MQASRHPEDLVLKGFGLLMRIPAVESGGKAPRGEGTFSNRRTSTAQGLSSGSDTVTESIHSASRLSLAFSPSVISSESAVIRDQSPTPDPGNVSGANLLGGKLYGAGLRHL